MDSVQFEHLLALPESESLDFKRDQYKFVGVKDEHVRSELLKDILAFANTSRDREAFIIVGVKKHPGGRAELFGIQPQTRPEDHLDDAQVQQFVNQKANAEVKFGYSEVGYDGKTFGVFRIPITDTDADGFRFLENDYGKLRKYHVYARQGSSTVLLNPDQIYKLGQASVVRPVPSFRVELVEPGSGKVLGTKAVFASTYVAAPEDIPDVRPHVPTIQVGGREFQFGVPDFHHNKECLREIAEYVHFAKGYHAFAVRLTNTGGVNATGVRLELAVSDPDVRFRSADEVPELPTTRRDPMIPRMPNLRRSAPDELAIACDPSGEYTLSTGELDIQPGRTITLDPPTYIMCRSSKVVTLGGFLYGDDLSKPVPVTFEFEFRVRDEQMNLDQLWETYRGLGKLERGDVV
jgi:hypothetical protein